MVEESSPSLCEVMSTTTVILQTQMCAEADHTHFQCNYAVQQQKKLSFLRFRVTEIR